MPKRRPRLTNCYVPTVWSSETTVNIDKVAPTRRYHRRDGGSRDPTETQSQQPQQPIQQLRGPLSLRPLLLQILNPANGSGSSKVTASTYSELGQTKVLCHVQAPIPSHQLPSSLLPLPTDHGILHCQVKYAPNLAHPTSRIAASSVVLSFDSSLSVLSSQQQRQSSTWVEAREAHYSRSLQHALADAVMLQQFPHTVIGVFVTVLQDDGGALEMAIAAASMALTQAEVPMHDFVVAVQTAIVHKDERDDVVENDTERATLKMASKENKLDDHMENNNARMSNRTKSDEEENELFAILVDPSLDELDDENIAATLRMAWMPNRKLVTLWEQQVYYNSSIPSAVTDKAMQACRQACAKILLPRLRKCLIEQQQEQDD